LTFNNLVCGKDYTAIFQADYQYVNCNDAKCSNYPGATAIVQNGAVPNGTIANGQCFGTTFQSSVCNNGTFSLFNQTCTYGCVPAQGCLQAPTQICVPNTVINGTCAGQIATQNICSNNGLSVQQQTIYCSSNQYCNNGKCINILQTPTSTTTPNPSGSLGTSCAWGNQCLAPLTCQFDPLNPSNLFWTCKTPSPVLNNLTSTTSTSTPAPGPLGYIISNQTVNPGHNNLCVGGIATNEPDGITFKYCPTGSQCYVTCQSTIDPTKVQVIQYNASSSTCGNLFSSSDYFLPANCYENSSLYPNICSGYTGYLYESGLSKGCNTQPQCSIGTTGDVCNYYAFDITGNNPVVNNRKYCTNISGISPDGCGALQGQDETFNGLTCQKDYYYVQSYVYKKVNCLDATCSQFTNASEKVTSISQNSPLAVGTKFNGHCVNNGAFYVSTICNNDGVLQEEALACNNGCSDALGCIPKGAGTCTPNLILNGTCLSDTQISQQICSNDGTYYFNRTVNCVNGQTCHSNAGTPAFCQTGPNLNGTNPTSGLSTNPVIIKDVFNTLSDPTLEFLILLTVACSIAYRFLDDEFIPILIYTIANFVLAVFNFFAYGYLLALFGFEMLLLTKSGEKEK
jgi:hypothetical protein